MEAFCFGRRGQSRWKQMADGGTNRNARARIKQKAWATYFCAEINALNKAAIQQKLFKTSLIQQQHHFSKMPTCK